jgi:hypothetical protein
LSDAHPRAILSWEGSLYRARLLGESLVMEEGLLYNTGIVREEPLYLKIRCRSKSRIKKKKIK